MLKSLDDLRTLGSLSQVNQTFHHAYKNESQVLLLSTARKEYGDLLDPMIEIAEFILNNEGGTISPLFYQRRRQNTTTPTPVFNSLLVKALLEIDSVLDTWLRIYEYRGPLGLLNYREMSSTPSLLERALHLPLPFPFPLPLPFLFYIGSISMSPARENTFVSRTSSSHIGPTPFFIDRSNNTGAFAAVHNSPARWEPSTTCQISSFSNSAPCTTLCTPSSLPY